MHAGSIIGSIGIADTTLVGGTTIDRNDQKSDRLAAKLLTIPIAIAPSGANDVRVDRQHSPADVGHRIVLSDMLTCLHRNAELVLPVRITFTIALTLILMSGLAENAAAVVRITDDRGGNIGVYWSRYMALRDAGEQVMIDGTCSSAPTLVLGIVPHDRICVTPNAVLGFHAAWRPGFLGFEIINDPGTRTLWNIYPVPIRQWISRNGGLGLAAIYLSGPELLTMYRQCR